MDEPVIDKSVYAGLQDTVGAEFAAELVDTFIEEASGMLAELRSALAERHAERFRRAAHSLKTNSNTFGAMKLGHSRATWSSRAWMPTRPATRPPSQRSKSNTPGPPPR